MTWYAHRRDDNTIASLHREKQPGYAEEALADDAAEVLALFPAPTYRQLRAVAYRDEMGIEQGNFIVTIGDVLDVVLGWAEAEIAAGRAQETQELAAALASRAAIKARFPKS